MSIFIFEAVEILVFEDFIRFERFLWVLLVLELVNLRLVERYLHFVFEAQMTQILRVVVDDQSGVGGHV